jgi:hypothetical protein
MALTPSPPAGSRAGPPISRGAPHVVKLRHPAPVPIELLELRVETAESRERASMVLLEDNAWMQLVLSQWNDVVSIDPNVAWAEEGAREVILRHQDRDWSMFLRAFHAQYRLAEERYRERIEAGAIALEEEHRELAQNLEKEEAQDLAEVLKWEKVHRPWFMPSLNSPKRKRGPGMGSGSTAEPTKPNSLSFAFRGRQQWMKEKQMLFERISHQNRFMKMEETEELARGSVEADEALVFMRIQQEHLEQRYLAHKRYLRRLKDIEDGVADSNLSEASIHRRQTDAAVKIQRQGRYYVAQKERERRQAEVAAKILEEEKKDEAARKIQRMGRAHTSKVELERRRAAAAESNEKRVEEEPFQPTKEEESVAATASATQTQRPSFVDAADADSSNQENTARRGSKGNKAVAAPWEADGAVKGYPNLQLLSRAIQDSGIHGRLNNLNPLWKSLGYRFDSPEADSEQGQGNGSALSKRVSTVKSAANVVKANMRLSGQPTKGYEMLDLLASTVNTLPATSKVGLLAVVDGLFSGSETRGAVLANGTYPYLEELLRQGKASGLIAGSTPAAEALPSPPAWVPTRSVSKGDLEKYWDIASHHHHVANAIELTPPRWKDYVTPEELEAEERLEMENSEMLRREHLVEAQLSEAYGLISMFYMMTKAREPSVNA